MIRTQTNDHGRLIRVLERALRDAETALRPPQTAREAEANIADTLRRALQGRRP